MRAKRATTLLISLATLSFVACGDRPTAPPPKPEVAAPAGQPPATAAAPAAALGNLGPLGTMFANRLEEPGPYDPPKQSPDFDANKPHWSTLELRGEIGEMSAISLLGGGDVVELYPLLQRLDRLSADANVQGLLLRFTDVALDMATAEELRGALVAFKADGKRKLACHAETPVNAAYYVMSACDSVGVQPVGEIILTGPAAMPMRKTSGGFDTWLAREIPA